MKSIAIAVFLGIYLTGSFAQPAAPASAPAASAPEKHKLLKKLKARKPASSAVNPEASPDKKGGA